MFIRELSDFIILKQCQRYVKLKEPYDVCMFLTKVSSFLTYNHLSLKTIMLN